MVETRLAHFDAIENAALQETRQIGGDGDAQRRRAAWHTVGRHQLQRVLQLIGGVNEPIASFQVAQRVGIVNQSASAVQIVGHCVRCECGIRNESRLGG